MYPDDFREPPNYPCLQSLLVFYDKLMPDQDLSVRAKLRLEKLKGEEEAFSNAGV